MHVIENARMPCAVLTIAVAVILTLGTGCGDDPTDAEKLADTTWIHLLEDGSICGIGITFNDDATQVTQEYLCELTDGTLGNEVRVADILELNEDDGIADLEWVAGSCPPPDQRRETVAYEFSDDEDRLTVTNLLGTIIYERKDSGGGGGMGSSSAIIEFGCYGADGSFYPSPVEAY